MSSSRRSVRSTRSTRSLSTAIWRKTFTKNSASTSLSYIFAEPEQGSPLASPISKLPSRELLRKPEQQEHEATSSFMPQERVVGAACEEPPNHDEDGVENHDTKVGLPGDSNDHQESTPLSGDAVPQMPMGANDNGITTELDDPPPKPSEPAGSSWFGSWSRAKGKAKASDLEIAALQSPATEPPSQPTTTTASGPTHPHLHEEEPFPRSQSKSRNAARRSWFSSAPTSSTIHPTTTTSFSPTPSASSDKDEKPSALPTSPEPVPPSSVLPTAGSCDTTEPPLRSSPLKHSSTRFPLLGLTKLPAEQAPPVSQSENPSNSKHENSKSQAVTFHSTDIPVILDAHPTTSTNTETRPSVPAEPLPTDSLSPDLVTSSSSSNQQLPPSSSSWWDYLSLWGKSSPDHDHVSDQPCASSELNDVHPTTSSTHMTRTTTTMIIPNPSLSGPENAPLPPPHAHAVTNDPSVSARAENGHPNIVFGGGTRTVDVETTKPPEGDAAVPEAESGSDEPRGALPPTGAPWYTPWAWYSTPAPAIEEETRVDGDNQSGGGGAGTEGKGAHVNLNVSGGSCQTQTGGGEGGEEEPRVRGEEQGAEQVQGGGGGTMRNPVEASIETHRSGWASFFSTRSLVVVKRITASGEDVKRDEDGMEIMDIEEEEKDVVDVSRGRTSELVAIARTSDKITTTSSSIASSPTKGIPINLKNAPSTTPVGTPPIGTRMGMGTKTVQGADNNNNINTSTSSNNNNKVTTKSAPPAPSGARISRPQTPVPVSPPKPNLVLPTWTDTFHAPPRNYMPPAPVSTLTKTVQFVSGMIWSTTGSEDGGDEDRAGKGKGKGKGKERESYYARYGRWLPKAWDVMDKKEGVLDPGVLKGCKRVVVIGIHGWFPGAIVRTVLGEPTGTSRKFANMMAMAIKEFQVDHNVKLDKITKIPLEGEGTINGRVERLYSNLKANREWMNDIHAADAIFVATHSQGSVVSTHLLDCLIRDGHIRTARNVGGEPFAGASGTAIAGLLHAVHQARPQRVCCLALCGIHLGPLRYLSNSTLIQPYIQYFESVAARELFEFQNTESDVSKNYVNALRRVLDHGIKMVYVASLNDQVVPLYSGLFTAASHPLILRALYIDGDAYHSSDFLSNLLVLLLRVLNSGLSDSGLLAHLSEATAGSLNGVGHSSAYEELSTYSLAVKYLFLTDDGTEANPELVLEPFNASAEKNDYVIPWALRDVIADGHIAHFFSQEIAELRDAFRDWHPKTSILRDLKKKLQPIQRLPTSFGTVGPSKL